MALLLCAGPGARAQDKTALVIKTEYPLWVSLAGTPQGSLVIRNAQGMQVGQAATAGDTLFLPSAGSYTWEFSPAKFSLDLVMGKTKDAPDRLLLTYLVDPSTKQPTIGYQKYVGKIERAPRYNFYERKNLWMTFN
ncbi:hypothetical protein [Mesoterricola silvestris]|uniref:Uncharacterized protein n=1 Tax=Mesoterricola silvestris TaxID=2927979 RepID=A0AA48K9Q2_9BACT|nr:hypothetical protein [Mesoterricola silvestris]BDU73310.1 hypothetical protein METEAL_24840 [Mesoterricola silvestris]